MRDLLTEAECQRLSFHPAGGEWWHGALQAAARLGAERERERAAMVCDDLARLIPLNSESHRVQIEAITDCAAAIRRGEGE